MNRPAQFTDAEVEKMRLIVNQHDKRTSPNVFDLNNPPRTNYTHQEYPKHLHAVDGDGKAIYLVVNDEAEEAAAIADGWALKPIACADDSEETRLDPAAAAEVAKIDETLAKKRKAIAKRSGK